jgi:hypothetical protein
MGWTSWTTWLGSHLRFSLPQPYLSSSLVSTAPKSPRELRLRPCHRPLLPPSSNNHWCCRRPCLRPPPMTIGSATHVFPLARNFSGPVSPAMVPLTGPTPSSPGDHWHRPWVFLLAKSFSGLIPLETSTAKHCPARGGRRGGLMTHKYRGCIVVRSISKSVEPNEEQKVLTSGFDQGFSVNTSKRVFRGIW